MCKYLWQLNLTNDDCGWTETFLNAIKHYPKGKVYHYKDMHNVQQQHFVNPVELFMRMQSLFNGYKQTAISLSRSLLKTDIRHSFLQLIECDVALYNLLYDWRIPENIKTGFTFFDPNIYFTDKIYLNYTMYFRGGRLFDELDNLRLINNLNFRQDGKFTYIDPIEP